jgi:hypothetical protein
MYTPGLAWTVNGWVPLVDIADTANIKIVSGYWKRRYNAKNGVYDWSQPAQAHQAVPVQTFKDVFEFRRLLHDKLVQRIQQLLGNADAVHEIKLRSNGEVINGLTITVTTNDNFIGILELMDKLLESGLWGLRTITIVNKQGKVFTSTVANYLADAQTLKTPVVDEWKGRATPVSKNLLDYLDFIESLGESHSYLGKENITLLNAVILAGHEAGSYETLGEAWDSLIEKDNVQQVYYKPVTTDDDNASNLNDNIESEVIGQYGNIRLINDNLVADFIITTHLDKPLIVPKTFTLQPDDSIHL